MHVKICGINSPEAAAAAADAGADAVGFVFAESPRQVTPEQALRIADELPGDVDRIAVFHRPAPGLIAEVLEVFPADVVQADHRHMDPHVPVRLLPVFREGIDDLSTIDAHLATSPDRRLLFEGPTSGTGRQVDLAFAARVARRSLMTLAGGLNIHNVAAAIRHAGPFGVDVSSGVEFTPGTKDAGLIREFIGEVREAEKEMVKP
ncbi:MAG: phosphoribosylanthranilate isomerase [Actinomycetota bacterium]|nr:phosphoribosylanthranilate isomerase [Actinomycetota bacterium]